MAKVRWVPDNIEVDVPVGTDLRTASKLAHAQQGDACGGKCACSTCHVYVHKGRELLSEAEEDEEDTIEKGFDVRATSRLACQTRVQKDGLIEIEIARESREAYFNEHPDEAPADWRKSK